MGLTQLIAPPVEPLTDEEVWAHLNVATPPHDWAHISSLIAAVRGALDGRDGWLGRALVQQTWRLDLDRFPFDVIEVPLPPLRSVTSITYADPAGAQQTLAPEAYQVDMASPKGRIAPAPGTTWPAARAQLAAVSVTFVAGYAPAGDQPDYQANIPPAIKAAMKLLIGGLYQTREDHIAGTIVSQNKAAAAMLEPFRVY